MSDAKIQPNESEDQNEMIIKQEENTSSNWDIDNPYLAATKLPNKDDQVCYYINLYLIS